MVRKLFKILLIFISLSAIVSCKKGVSVDSDYAPPVVGNSPDGLNLVLPENSPFYTQDSTVRISGFCRSNSTVLLQGDVELDQGCSDGQFSFDVSLTEDRGYSFSLVQQRGEFLSNSIPFVVIRKTSVSQPALTNPTTNPFGSASTTLTVTGTCETGSRIDILVDSSLQSTSCADSNFSSTISKFSDGAFPVRVTQIDQAGNEAFTEFIWTKQDLSANPPSPQVVVANSQVFNIEGGTAPYDVQLTTNNSGATFDIGTLTYTAGTTSGVVDLLTVTDSLSFTTTIPITVIPDVADRFEFPTLSGNFQTAIVGRVFSEPIIARVVDQYGNAVPNFSVVFKKVGGDLSFMDTKVISTNALGEASVILNQGYTSVRSSVVVSPLIGSLPDIGATGRGNLIYSLNTNSNNTGNLGLDFSVGNGAENTLVSLLNADAFDDVVVLNKSDRTIDVYLGNSAGLLDFSNRITGLCNSPTSLVGGDFNSDGLFDMVLTCASTAFYYFFEGQGTGSFQSPVAAATDVQESLILDAFTANLNSDIHLDLAFISTGTDRLTVRFGVGDGTFSNPVVYNTSDTPVKVVSSDVDNSNGNDLIVLNSTVPQTAEVYLNNGSGLFISPTGASINFVANGSSALLARDVTGDNFDDLIIVNNIDGNFATFVNNTDGTFAASIDTTTGSSPVFANVFNFNGDSNQDVFVANIGDNTVSVFSGNGNGSFILDQLIPTKVSPNFVTPLDINQDSELDLLVVASGSSEIQVFPSDGTGNLGLEFEVDAGPVDVLGLDFNNDGVRDKAVLSRNLRNVKLYEGNNKGQFNFDSTLSTGLIDPVAFLTDDFNSDGFDDIAVINSTGTSLAVYLNTAGAGFGTPQVLQTQSQPTHLASGDLDSDGFPDVVVTNSGSNSFSTFLSNGDGTLQNRRDLGTDAQPLGVQIADLTADRVLDVVLVNGSEATDNVSVYAGVGDGTFSSPARYTAETSPSKVVVGFFNTDTIPDMAVLNTISASVSIFIGQNGGGFGSPNSPFIGSDAVDMVLADVDGNSAQDLVISNSLNRNYRVLFGSPSGIFTTTRLIDTNEDTQAIDVDDVNGDGAIDISIIGTTTGVLKTYMGH